MALEIWWLKATDTLYISVFETLNKDNLRHKLGNIHQVPSRQLFEFHDHVHMYQRKRCDIDIVTVPGHTDQP